MFNKRRILIYFGLLVVVLFVFLVRGAAFGLNLCDWETWRQMVIDGIIPKQLPVRYDSDDMFLFEKFVDKQSRRALKAYAYTDQQVIITYKNGIESIIIETAKLPQEKAVVVIPVPEIPEIEEANQDLFIEASNNVFYKLFAGFYVISGNCSQYPYHREKIDTRKIIEQRKNQKIAGKKIEFPLIISDSQLRKKIKMHNLDVNQVTVFTTEKPEEFIEFFEKNYFSIPGNRKNNIMFYTDKGWSFVIIKVKNHIKGEVNPPVKITFKSPEMVFPLRICPINNNKEVTNLNLFIFSDKETGAEGFYRIWQGKSKGIVNKTNSLPPRLSVLTGIIDNAKISADANFRHDKSIAWIIPTNKGFYQHYLTVTIIYLIIVLTVFFLYKRKQVPIPGLYKKLSAVILIILIATTIINYIEYKRKIDLINKCYEKMRMLASALEIYHTDYNRYPDSLHQLVPEYIDEVPEENSADQKKFNISYKLRKENLSFHRLLSKNRYRVFKPDNDKPVVFPLCGEFRVVIDDGK